MSPEEQLELWVAGDSQHNHTIGECCPDFSCCKGEIAPQDVRDRFYKAFKEDDEYVMHEMLMMFLGEAFKDKKIYVAGGNIPPTI